MVQLFWSTEEALGFIPCKNNPGEHLLHCKLVLLCLVGLSKPFTKSFWPGFACLVPLTTSLPLSLKLLYVVLQCAWAAVSIRVIISQAYLNEGLIQLAFPVLSSYFDVTERQDTSRFFPSMLLFPITHFPFACLDCCRMLWFDILIV